MHMHPILRLDLRNNKFYLGGLSGLTSKDTRAVVYDPYPLYNTAAWRGQWKGDFQSCEGPRGADLDRSSPDDMTTVYRGNQEGSSPNILGDPAPPPQSVSLTHP